MIFRVFGYCVSTPLPATWMARMGCGLRSTRYSPSLVAGMPSMRGLRCVGTGVLMVPPSLR